MYLKFNDDNKVYSTFTLSFIDTHTIELKGIQHIDLRGFKIYKDEDLRILAANFSKYIYDYGQPLPEGTYRYTDDGHKWVRKPPKIGFTTTFGGMLNGITEQVIDDYSELFVPTPVANKGYEFSRWNPPIPTSGEVKDSRTFTAIFEYVEPIESVRQRKHEEFSKIANETITNGQDIELSDGKVEHFFYKSYDQVNIKNAFDLANAVYQKTGEPKDFPFYDAENNCKLYPYQDIAKIYMSMQTYITYITTLCHQLQAMVKDSEDKEFIESLTFDKENLTGKYLETFNLMLEQAKKIVETLVG